jgi:hypothetical protein
MSIHIVIGIESDESRWRGCVDPVNGFTSLYKGGRCLARGWYCPPGAWKDVEPQTPEILSAFERIGSTLSRMDWSPETLYRGCMESTSCPHG